MKVSFGAVARSIAKMARHLTRGVGQGTAFGDITGVHD